MRPRHWCIPTANRRHRSPDETCPGLDPGSGDGCPHYAALHAGYELNLLQRTEQIAHDVVRVLEPGGEPNQSIADPKFRARFRRQALMRRRRRMRDQALGVAEIVSDADELERVEKPERAGLVATCHFERDERRTTAHLSSYYLGLRVISTTGINQP